MFRMRLRIERLRIERNDEMNGAETRKMNDEEITVELRRLSRRLFDLRTQSVTEKIEDVSQFRTIRRDVARLKTERRARQLREASKR